MIRLKRRADFLAAAKGRRSVRRGFVLQIRTRADDPAGPPRFGFTVTKKVGNAVERNRIRRRLKELVRLSPPARSGHDFVLVGRRAALKVPFDQLSGDFAQAMTDTPPAGSRRHDTANG